MTQYTFDPHGIVPENFIEETLTVSSTAPSEYNFIVPSFAPFYKDDFEIVHINTGYPLKENIDLHFSHRFEEATIATAKPVYGSITFMRHDLSGPFRVKGRSIGGVWVLDEAKILEMLAARLVNPRTVKLEDVAGYPTYFPPVDHPIDADDLTRVGDIVYQISRIADAVEEQSEPTEEAPSALQRTFPHVNSTVTTWTRFASLNMSEIPASDFVIGIAGAEAFNESRSSFYIMTAGVRGEDVKVSVSNLAQFDGGCRFAYRFLEVSNLLELWIENVPNRSKLTFTTLSRGSRFVYGGGTVTENPMNLSFVEVAQVGNGVAEDSKLFGGHTPDFFVPRHQYLSDMHNLTLHIMQLAGVAASDPNYLPAAYFVSRTLYTVSMQDIVDDLQAVVAYMAGEEVTLPEPITLLPPEDEVPTNLPSYFISRAEVVDGIAALKDEMESVLSAMEDDGIIGDKEALLMYIKVPSENDVPFHLGMLEETTNAPAIDYMSKIEFNHLMATIVLAINGMINTLANASSAANGG